MVLLKGQGVLLNRHLGQTNWQNKHIALIAIAIATVSALLVTHPKFRAFKRDFTFTRYLANSKLQMSTREETSKLATMFAMQGQFAMAGVTMMTRYGGSYSHQGDKANDLLKAGKYFLQANHTKAARWAFRCAEDVSETPALFYLQRTIWKVYLEAGQIELLKNELKSAEAAKPYKTLPGRRHYWYNLKETYEELGDAAGAARMKVRMEDKHCPVCGSDKAITQLVDEELLKICRIQRGEPWDAKWRCNKDKVEF